MSTVGLLIAWKSLKASIFSLGVRKIPRDRTLLNYEIISQGNIMGNTTISIVHFSKQLPF